MENDTVVIEIDPRAPAADPEPSLVRARWIRRLPEKAHVGIGVLSTTVIAVFDWITGPDTSMELLYVFAVMATTWIGSRRYGYLTAFLAAAESMAVHVARRGHSALPVAIWNATIRLGVLLTVAWLLCRLRAAIITQRRQAAMDPLTGTLNRRAFQEAAERERLRSIRDGTPLSVAYLDLDRFKDVNDRYGHRAGDRILRTFTETVTGAIRGSDLLARIGGDEFILLLPATGARDAVTALQRVQAGLRVAEWGIGERIRVSIGIATYREPPVDIDAMVDEADALMYRAKRHGGDRIVGAVIAGSWIALAPENTVDVHITRAGIERVAG